MPTAREIKGHIQSVRTIAKVTKAMETVSAAKNQHLQSRMKNARFYAEKSRDVLNHLASAAEAYLHENPFFCGRPVVKRLGIVLISSDRGLVGAYNHNVIDLTTRTIQERALPVELITLGTLGREAMLERGYSIHADFKLDDKAELTALTPVTRVLLDGFEGGLFDQVLLAHTQLRGGIYQQPLLQQILPVCPTPTAQRRLYLYEPGPVELLQALLPRLVRFQIYYAFLEALVAENMARMMAMHSATRNGNDLIGQLTISYNKVRQEAITAEIMDILGGTATVTQR